MSELDKYSFPGPRWQWRALGYAMQHGPVDNLLTITGDAKKPRHVYLSVPTDFVKFLHDVVKIKNTLVSLWMDYEEVDERYAFGFTIEAGGGPVDYHLWYYTRSSLPQWARR